MDNKKFRLWDGITSAVVFVIAAFTYLSTIEPTASFWDCGEFIASSYKLEVGHPPGNPMFQLIARFFTMFTDAAHAAVAVNVMSALCSALTIFLLYLTIVFFAKRLAGKPEENGGWSQPGDIDMRQRCDRSIGILFLRHILVLGCRGRGLCDVVAFHSAGSLGYDQMVRPGGHPVCEQVDRADFIPHGTLHRRASA